MTREMTINELLENINSRLNNDSRMVIWSPYITKRWDVHLDLEWAVDHSSQRMNIRRQDMDLYDALFAAYTELVRIQDAVPESQPPLLGTIDHE